MDQNAPAPRRTLHYSQVAQLDRLLDDVGERVGDRYRYLPGNSDATMAKILGCTVVMARNARTKLRGKLWYPPKPQPEPQPELPLDAPAVTRKEFQRLEALVAHLYTHLRLPVPPNGVLAMLQSWEDDEHDPG